MKKNKLYYVKTKMLCEYRIIASSIFEALEQIKTIEGNSEIVEVKLLEENIIIGVKYV